MIAKFFFNFFLFGFIYYMFWFFFPEAFQAMVGWAEQAFAFLSNATMQLFDKVQNMRQDGGVETEQALLLIALQALRNR